jgi:hypothetical protein
MNGFHRLRMVSHRCQPSDHRHLPGDAFSLLRMLCEKQPDRHPPGSAWSGSVSSFRFGLAIQC